MLLPQSCSKETPLQYALEAWLPDALMQSIAQENNLSETAFFVPQGEGFEIRWFTPNDEVAFVVMPP